MKPKYPKGRVKEAIISKRITRALNMMEDCTRVGDTIFFSPESFDNLKLALSGVNITLPEKVEVDLDTMLEELN